MKAALARPEARRVPGPAGGHRLRRDRPRHGPARPARLPEDALGGLRRRHRAARALRRPLRPRAAPRHRRVKACERPGTGLSCAVEERRLPRRSSSIAAEGLDYARVPQPRPRRRRLGRRHHCSPHLVLRRGRLPRPRPRRPRPSRPSPRPRPPPAGSATASTTRAARSARATSTPSASGEASASSPSSRTASTC